MCLWCLEPHGLMDATDSIDGMGRTSIQTSDELADELWNRKKRGESYEDVIWRLIEQADAAENEETDTRERTRERPEATEPEPEPEEDTEPADSATADDAVAAVVDHVSDGWEDTDERLRARRAAARAVLQHAIDTGEAVGRTDAVEKFLPDYAVDGQNEETWYRKNIRPVLKHVGDYSSGQHGYVVDGLGE